MNRPNIISHIFYTDEKIYNLPKLITHKYAQL